MSLRQNIITLFSSQYGQNSISKLNSIADQWKQQEVYLDALKGIQEIEKGLGPIGIWSSNYDGKLWSFSYPRAYDGVYRELKYVYIALFTSSPLRLVVTRDIVHYSVAHVENCLKIFYSRKGFLKYGKQPLGSLAGVKLETLMEKDLVDALRLLAKIWNPAKHEYDLGGNTSMFTPEDALMTYLSCRKLGFRILSLAGELPHIEEACSHGPLVYPSLLI